MQLPPNAPGPPVVTLDRAGIAALAEVVRRVTAGPGRRAVLAIAGVPGSGKSTLARAVADRLNQQGPGSALVVGMDGFHLPNADLAQLGLTDRKGSPPTFDALGYFKLLTQLRDARRSVSVPVFDRGIDEPVYTGKPEHAAGPKTRFVITEGNYLLLDSLPWTVIDELADLRVWLDTPVDRARQWILQRHTTFGRSRQAAEQWYESNDKLNSDLVQQHSRHADRIARWP